MRMKGDSIISRSQASLKAPEPPQAWQQWSSPAPFHQRKPSISSGRGCPPPCLSQLGFTPPLNTSICCPDSQLPSCAPVSPHGSFDMLPFCSRKKKPVSLPGNGAADPASASCQLCFISHPGPGVPGDPVTDVSHQAAAIRTQQRH